MTGTDGRGTLSAVDPAVKHAYEYAAQAHAGSYRKGGSAPYILHPAAVATLVRETGIEDAATLRAALLHDVAENSSRTVADIREEFGETIADLVAELTRPKDTRQNQDAFRSYLSRLSPKARVIKLADRIDNVRGLRAIQDDLEFVRGYLDETRTLFLSGWARESHPDLARILEQAYRAAVLKRFEDLRTMYRPKRLRLLVLGESPPDPDQGEPRFFYDTTVSRHQYVFLGMMEALYGARSDEVTRSKTEWLRRFQADGFWMLDALDAPSESRKRTDRLAALRKAAPDVVERVKTLASAGGVILCHPLADEALRPFLRKAGIPLLHEGALPFPLPQWRRSFVERVRLAMMIGGIRLEIQEPGG